MKLRSLCAFALTALLLGGCAKKFDASTEESRKSSAQAMRKALPEDQREKLDRSVAIIAMNGLSLSEMAHTDAIENKIASLDGKTAEQIIAEADAIVAEREAQERAQALQEIDELEKKKAKSTSDAQELKKFEVTRSRFYQEYNEYSIRPDPKMEISMRNGTPYAVARVFAVGTIATPGRSIPWIREDFNFSVAGGVEPGETHDAILSPNMFSEWGSVAAPADAVFTVEIVGLEGPDEVRVLSSDAFSEHDNKRLLELKKKFP